MRVYAILPHLNSSRICASWLTMLCVFNVFYFAVFFSLLSKRYSLLITVIRKKACMMSLKSEFINILREKNAFWENNSIKILCRFPNTKSVAGARFFHRMQTVKISLRVQIYRTIWSEYADCKNLHIYRANCQFFYCCCCCRVGLWVPFAKHNLCANKW